MKLADFVMPIPLAFDVARLLDEVRAFAAEEWIADPAEPARFTLPLIDEANGAMRCTAALERSPYLRQVIASFESAVGMTRLVRVEGTSVPLPHADGGRYWLRHVRIHVPIVCGAGVRLVCGEQSFAPEPGVPWIFDTWRPHAIVNREPGTRIHLVIDTVGSAAFWNLVNTPLQRRFVDFDPAKNVWPRTERVPPASFHCPFEQEELLKLILDSLPAQNDAVPPLTKEIARFLHDWASVCSTSNDGEAWPFLEELCNEMDERLTPYEGAVTLSNGVDAASAIRASIESRPAAAVPSWPASQPLSEAGPRAPRQHSGDGAIGVETDETLVQAVAHEAFASILFDYGVSLAVSSAKPGRVILLRATSPSTLDMSVRAFRSPFGIAWRNGGMAIGTEREVWGFANDEAVTRTLLPKRDACFVPRTMWFTGSIATHEIAFAGDELWIVNTFFSTLCTLDGRHSFVPRWHPRFIDAPSPGDACHLNGLAVEDGRVRLVTAFGDCGTPAGWRERLRESGVLIDVESAEIVARGLSVPHSPRLYNREAFVLESWKGSLGVVDLDRGNVETVVEVPGFTRGLAFAGPFAFVGLSKLRPGRYIRDDEVNPPAPPMPLLRRFPETECGIRIIDLRTGHEAASLRFDRGATEIFDLQVLPFRAPDLFEPHSAVAGTAFTIPAASIAHAPSGPR